jgi:hypothetical protein
VKPLNDALDAIAADFEARDGMPMTAIEREAIAYLFASDTPAVHAAMLDALTRHGVLIEKRKTRYVDDPDWAGAFISDGQKRRLVTPWEVAP